MINSRVLLHVIFFFLHDELTIKKQRNLMTDIRLPPCYRITSVHFRSGQWRLTNMSDRYYQIKKFITSNSECAPEEKKEDPEELQ